MEVDYGTGALFHNLWKCTCVFLVTERSDLVNIQFHVTYVTDGSIDCSALVMASSKPIPCGPCIEGKVNTKADIWCYNCDEGLCSTCSGHHRRSKGTRDHKIIGIKSYKPSVQVIETQCDKHGQQLNLYCPSHLMPCCDECISNSHSKCTGIKSLASVVEKTKIEKSLKNL
ncbi:Hypothetical predicted protein [Mytilus galloprovincialis]|uniref:B box-type domain-containing protein n=1 Tax=Mytilus galloprovincialis TaxID=29158 RepID=A0A8B6CQP6_MYTGA|nr:Hypothetical predicted protein [Mytilus galloprovincialis]